MATLLITYDLNSPGQNYEDVHAAIKSLGDCKHPLESTWFVKTTMSPRQVHDKLNTVTDEGDRWFIGELTSNHWGLLDKAIWEWLRQ